MSEVLPEPDLPELAGTRRLRLWPQRWRWRISLVLALLIALAGGLAWYNREQIAADLIDDTLTQYGLVASYNIEEIGARRQVITKLVIGDPALPDFTAERVSLDISYTYGPPELGLIELVGARAYGSFREGVLSFGSLDPLILAESEEPAGLPALNLRIVDGRALLQTDYGGIGAKLEGEGQLDDGFAGTLAATAPGVGTEGCKAQAATVYGDLTSSDGRLSFDGPIRLREASCEGARIDTADIGAQLTLASDFAAVEGDLALSATRLAGPGAALSKLGGGANVAWRFDGELSVRHDLDGEGFASEYANAQSFGADGTLRSREGFTRNEWTARLIGRGMDAQAFARSAALAQAREASAGTFAEALLGKFENGLAGAVKGGAFAGDVSVRTDPDSIRLAIPEARLRSSDGETLLALSRVNYASAAGDQPQRLTGNVLTGGAGLPRINARLQPTSGSATTLRMTMAEYRDGRDAIAIPRLEATRDASGRIRFTGMVRAEGAIPGGSVRGLSLPIEGGWSQASGLALGSKCLDARFAALEAYDFVLSNQSLSICPIQGRSMVRYNDTLEVAAKLDELAIAGQYGEAPVTLTTKGATLRYPGGFEVLGIDAAMGSGDEAMSFAAISFDGSLTGGLEGRFDGGSADLGTVPVNLSDIAGRWSFADDALQIREGTFLLTDRPDPALGEEARFEPVIGVGANFDLIDGSIAGGFGVENPWSRRKLAEVSFGHDLTTAKGSAEFLVPGIRFEEGFQPDDLTPLTKGLIAFADGVIAGRGQIAWDEDELTSSASFSTDRFDFAAAFGPVQGVKGTIEFTDLLNLTTAPSQVATIQSVNPGIEVFEGQVVYAIENGTLITLEDGRWPFMGGELILRPVTLDYGGGQGQSYIFEIVALDAATFVTEMELANIGATGEFDGTIPIIFDAQGNGTIQGGLLISRPPGGNVSYVGELTYEDLGAMGNFAFQTLRSIDYNQMSVELNGNLAGEIITNFNIDGVRQGAGTSKNFVTRQLSKLPIRFKINVRSSNFYTLALIVRGLFDPTVFASAAEVERFVGDNLPALQNGRGIKEPDETDPQPGQNPDPDTIVDQLQRRNEPPVQPPESDEMQ